MVKRFNQENFFIDMPDGKVYSFYCWTTHTRMGFCHTVWCVDTDQTTKVSYTNRTWECYTYQVALRNAFEKFPAETRKILEAWDKQHEKEVTARCEREFSAFKAAYDAAPESTKQMLANSDVHLETEEQVDAMTKLLKLSTVLGA